MLSLVRDRFIQAFCFVVISQSVLPQLRAQDWQTINVPGAWEDQLDGELEEHDGFAWYRCRVKVPKNWTDLDGRPLWYESVTLTVSRLADAHELYINGRKIGGAGSLPPKFADGQKEVRRYKVPPGSLEAGKYNTIALRVYNESDQGGVRRQLVLPFSDN